MYGTVRNLTAYGYSIWEMQVFQAASPVSQSIGSLSSSDPTTSVSIAPLVTLSTGGNNSSTTYAGSISGFGILAKVGSGTLTLSGTGNSYSGATTVNGGVLLAGTANALSPYSDMSVGTNGTPGTLDVTAGVPSRQVADDRSFGALNQSLGNPLASSLNLTFSSGSTIDISGAISGTPQLLMTYGGTYSGTFTNVFDNGSRIPASDLTYTGGLVEVSTAVSSFSGSGTWIRRHRFLEYEYQLDGRRQQRRSRQWDAGTWP